MRSRPPCAASSVSRHDRERLPEPRSGASKGPTMTAPLRPGDPTIVNVALGDRAYDIVIGRGQLAALGARAAALKPGAKAAIVSDDTVARLHLEAAEAALAAGGLATSRVGGGAGGGAEGFFGFEGGSR